MHTVKPFMLLLVLSLVLGGLPHASTPAHAADPPTYHGVVEYRMRGPAASPYGIGSSLLVGAAVPVAIARIQNVLRHVIEIAGGVPGLQDNPTMGTVRAWMDEGIPIDLAQELPVAGAYEATVTFTLEEGADGTFQLRSGTVRWRTSNQMRISDGELTLHDDFGGSGTHALDPARDTISLTMDGKRNPPLAELEMEIHHPEPVDGSSTWSGPPGTFEITMEASGGEMVLDGSALGIPISAVGAPTPMTIVEAPGLDRTVSYGRKAPMDEIGYHVEMWQDAFDNQVFVEYELRTECEASIVTPEHDAVLTYDESDEGVLEVTAEAKTQTVGLNALLDDLVWTFPEIAGSTLTTDPEDGRGRTVTAQYEGLPPKNSDFGEKVIEAHFDAGNGCEDPEPRRVRVFFPRDASNNPDEELPNWFYYWRQTRAGQGHGDAILYDGEDEESLGYYLGFKIPEEANRIYVCDLAEVDFESINDVTGKYTEGIDLFGSVVLHEWTHLENRHDWWPDGMDSSLDRDSDWVRDDREEAYGLDPENPDTFGLGMLDREIPAYLQEHTWMRGSANSVDWANPGKQSGGGD